MGGGCAFAIQSSHRQPLSCQPSYPSLIRDGIKTMTWDLVTLNSGKFKRGGIIFVHSAIRLRYAEHCLWYMDPWERAGSHRPDRASFRHAILPHWQASPSIAVVWRSENLVDTAQGYRNEGEVGIALHESGLSRGDVFITTKYSGFDGLDIPTAIRNSVNNVSNSARPVTLDANETRSERLT